MHRNVRSNVDRNARGNAITITLLKTHVRTILYYPKVLHKSITQKYYYYYTIKTYKNSAIKTVAKTVYDEAIELTTRSLLRTDRKNQLSSRPLLFWSSNGPTNRSIRGMTLKDFTVVALILVAFCCLVAIVAFALRDANSRQKILAERYGVLMAANEQLLNEKSATLGQVESLQKVVVQRNAEIKQLKDRLANAGKQF